MQYHPEASPGPMDSHYLFDRFADGGQSADLTVLRKKDMIAGINPVIRRSATPMDTRRHRFEAQALPHLDAAYNLARWLARSPADADDIVQDAMLRAFAPSTAFAAAMRKPWLLAIVRNCWRSAGADTKRRGTRAAARGRRRVALTSDEPDPEARAVRGERRPEAGCADRAAAE